MPAQTPPKQHSDALTYALVFLIIALSFCLYLRPTTYSSAVTLTRATLTPVPTLSPTLAAAPTPTAAPSSAEPIARTYVLNTNTRRFHKPTCKSVNTIKEKNRSDFTGTREELIERGYIPCGSCNP